MIKTYNNNFTYEQLMVIEKRDPWLLRELCRKFFWIYCMITEPDFYNYEHYYLKTICDELQDFYENDPNEFFVLSIPPQHGKSRTLKKFEAWIAGNDVTIRFFSISYNEDYATDSSKNLLTEIRAEHEDDKYVFHDIFPDVTLKRGEAASNRWTLKGGYNTWLSASTNSGVTGRSANIIVVDDIIKDYKTAVNKNELKKIWTWFKNTLFSRRGDNDRKIIIVMTRWSKDDLAGHILKEFENVRNVVMKAYDPIKKKMLCDAILNFENYQKLLKISSEDLIEANYNQQPIDLKGQLYTRFNTFYSDDRGIYIEKDTDNKPKYINLKKIVSVTDTADQGSDWLCSICFAEDYNKNAYILDIYYTKDAAETTIPELARFFKKNKVSTAVIESNNGGRLFALAVKKELEDVIRYYSSVKWFHQSKNKKARIISAAMDVMNRVYFPENFEEKYYDYYTDMNEYQKEGEMEHDDAPDCTTMIVEYLDGQLIKK